MEIVGLEPRRSDLARGILIARSARALDASEQKALWDSLAAAGVTEQADDDTEDEPARQWHAAPWIPPDLQQVDPQRLAIEATAERFGVEAVWCVKIESSIDAIAWLEMTAVEAPSDDDEEEGDEGGEREVVDGIFDDNQEVIYAAPDAPAGEEGAAGASDGDDDDDEDADEEEDDDDELIGDDDDVIALESHWRNGAPPMEHSVPFPIERYPEIIDEYDWESFGIAFKLAGTALAGEESVVNAFFALWLSVYQDERAEESGPGYEPFQRADVIHDRKHRSALMWVERFSVPATASDQVHFLLWIVARLHDILPLAWARFDTVDESVKAAASGDYDDTPFVLAGNPFGDRFARQGEEAALAWAVSQSLWSKRELAGMLVEVALEHDPDNTETATTAERLLRRALSFEPKSEAAGYLCIVLIRQHRAGEAIGIAQNAASRDVRLLVVGEVAEHDPSSLPAALELLDAETFDETAPEELAELTSSIARHSPQHLSAMLAKLPDDAALVPHLYNASFAVDRPLALTILRRVLSLPAPPRDAGEARTALVMAWNNACIHAHALGDYKLAVELADGGQPYGPENPYIYHSAACAYAAVGEIERALEQVRFAIEHEYEHTEKMETDADLSPLHADARFPALFNEWRTRRADLN